MFIFKKKKYLFCYLPSVSSAATVTTPNDIGLNATIFSLDLFTFQLLQSHPQQRHRRHDFVNREHDQLFPILLF